MCSSQGAAEVPASGCGEQYEWGSGAANRDQYGRAAAPANGDCGFGGGDRPSKRPIFMRFWDLRIVKLVNR